MDSENSKWIEQTAKWLPALLLLAVVANHCYRVQAERLNPRAGGGFGMFAVVDRPSSRSFYAEGVDEAGNRRRIFIDFSGAGSLNEFSQRLDRRVRTMPEDDSLVRIAELLLAARYRVEDPRVFANLQQIRQTLDLLPPGTLDEPYFRSFAPDEQDLNPQDTVRLRGVRFQMRSVVFHSDTTSYTAEPLTPWIVKGDW